MRRIHLTFNDADWAKVAGYIEENMPYLPVTTAVKQITLLKVTESIIPQQSQPAEITEKQAGTDIAPKTLKKLRSIYLSSKDSCEEDLRIREAARRIIGRFNMTCGGLVSTADRAANDTIATLLGAYTEADAVAVIDWGNEEWPPGSKWRPRCLNIGYLFGHRFSAHLTAAGQASTPVGFEDSIRDQLL